jgi:glutamate carboxypeptidase
MSSLPHDAHNDPDARSLRDWLEAHTDEMLHTLEALVRIESPTPDPSAQHRVFGLISALLEDIDYTSRHLSGDASGGILLAYPENRPRRGPRQLLVGHADTVWGHGTLDEIPYSIRQGVVRGPGTYDMKGGLVQMIFALRALRELDLTPSVMPTIFINSDEEIGSTDSTRHIARLARCMDRALILEPSLGLDGRLKTMRKGVGQFLLTVHGRASHAGLCPEEGISAILEMSHIIQALHALNDPQQGISLNVGEITGGTRPNVVPARAGIVVDVRVLTERDAAAIEDQIRALQTQNPEAQLLIEGGFLKRPMEATPRNQRLWQRARVAAGRLGIPLEQARAGGASDGNTTSLHTATLDGLGAVGGGAHARTEFLYADKLPERAALLALLLLEPPLADARR